MVKSRFTARKTPDVESVQVLIRPQNAFGIKSNNILYVMVYIHLKTKKANIKKENS